MDQLDDIEGVACLQGPRINVCYLQFDPKSWTPSSSDRSHLQSSRAPPSSHAPFGFSLVPFFVLFPSLPIVFGVVFLALLSIFTALIAFVALLEQTFLPFSPLDDPSSFLSVLVSLFSFGLPQPRESCTHLM